MTLTTEQLRARAKFWREKAVEAKWESVSIAQDMLQNADAFEELAANRMAQPVALVDRRPAASGSICWQNGSKDLPHGTELFTAPPAPANAQAVAWEIRYWNSGYNMWGEWERITAEQHAEMSAEHAADNDYEFRILCTVTPAPQPTNAADWGIDMQTGTPILVYKNCSVIESEQAHYVLSLINSAAPAVPAQPVSQRYTLPPHVFRELVNSLRDTAVKYQGTQQLREQLSRTLTDKGLSAAAPEGGNG